MVKTPYNYKNKRIYSILSKKILCIEILKNDVYIEYINGNIEYMSFSKAKQVIYSISQENFQFSCIDNEKSNTFLNLLLGRYKINQNTLLLR